MTTIQSLIQTEQHLIVHCRGCDHVIRYAPREACALFGAQSTIPSLRRKLRCTRCGATGEGRDCLIDVRPCMSDYYAKLHFAEAERQLAEHPADTTAQRTYELRKTAWERRRPREPAPGVVGAPIKPSTR